MLPLYTFPLGGFNGNMEQSIMVGTAEMIGHLKTLHKDRSKNVFVRLSLIAMVLLIG